MDSFDSGECSILEVLGCKNHKAVLTLLGKRNKENLVTYDLRNGKMIGTVYTCMPDWTN